MKIDAEILISAPPHVVREVLLNFPDLLTWHDGSFWESVEVLAPGKTTGLQAVEGDNVKCTMPSTTFSGHVEINEPNHFKWANSLPLLGSAAHDYYFKPSLKDPNETIFIQHEEITGAIGYIVALMGSEKQSQAGWKKVNEDLKVAAEKMWASQQGS